MKKTVVITGSTDGIGKGAALKLAQEGHEIYVHGRNAQKVDATIEELKQQSNNGKIDGLVADFSDLQTVRQMAEQIKDKLPKIDVLINNAGVYKSSSVQNKDGLDMRIMVNYIAAYVLTTKLLPILKKGTEPRVVNLSSAAQSPVSYEVLEGKAGSTESQAYAQSKLALTMWSFHLSKTELGIAVLAVNPGSLLNTKMVKEAFGNHWSPADKGSKILYDLTVSGAYKGISGKYYDNDKGAFAKAHQDAYDQDKIKRLIEVTEKIVTNDLY